MRLAQMPEMRIEEMVYAPGLCVERHSHETDNLIYIVSGTHWSSYSRGGEACHPRTVRFLPAGEPHENYFPAQSRCLAVEMRQPTIGLAPGKLTKPSAPGLGARLYREFRQRDDMSAIGMEATVLELLLADRHDDRPGPIPAWLLRIREMLREERPTLADLSRAVGRHPVQISRQFHHYFGCTISDYVRRVRIGRAQSLLSRGDRSVAETALACGFCDQSHFTTAFGLLVGMSPRQWLMAKK
jgi:AraC family transcriptional regulator